MELSLLVIRTPDPKTISDFYSLLGFSFDYHKHGNSPYHYSVTVGATVMEIYPLTKTQQEPDKNLRLGFAFEDFDEIVQRLKFNNTKFLTEPTQTDLGFMTIVEDPDGRKIEIYKK